MQPKETASLEDLTKELRHDLEKIASSLWEREAAEAQDHGLDASETTALPESEARPADETADGGRLANLGGEAWKRSELFLEQFRNWHQAELCAEKERISILTSEARKWRSYFGRALDLVSPMSMELNRLVMLLDDGRLAGFPGAVRDQLINRRQNLDIISRMLDALPSHHRSKAAVFESAEIELREVLPLGDSIAQAFENQRIETETKASENDTDKEALAEMISRLDQSVQMLIRNGESIREANARVISGLEEKVRRSRETTLDFFRRFVLPVVDGVERGGKQWELINLDSDSDFESARVLLQECIATHGHLEDALFGHLETIDIFRLVAEKGQIFDVEVHNPVYIEETSEVEDGAVLEMVRSGYRFGDGLLRPADVILARRKDAPPADTSVPSEAGDETPGEAVSRNGSDG